ncbi:MAG: hypothetical protein ACERKD_04605 [Prolixibacteraceae bacterium]
MGLIKPSYKIVYPETDGDFKNQWMNCLEQLIHDYERQIWSPIRVNIFVQSENQADYLAQHKLIQQTFLEAFGPNCPPFGVVMQEPEDPYRVICEVGFVKNTESKVIYGFFQERPYCMVDAGNYREYWTIGAQSVHPDLNILASSNAAFTYLKELYLHLGISFNNIVRQWNYVGEILSTEDDGENRLRQHYQMFNESRSDFYGTFRTRKDFPAATGIGMKYLGVCIDSFAVTGNENLKIIPISNPVQSESYQYGQKVLVGKPDKKMRQNQPPQFERAKLIALHRASRILVSGTASIIGQETIGIGEVEEQTRVTIQNIKTLTHPDNILKHFPEIIEMPKQYSYVRVYVKLKTDIAKVRPICLEAFGDVPTTYVVADICRDNLLVEIEAELIS